MFIFLILILTGQTHTLRKGKTKKKPESDRISQCSAVTTWGIGRAVFSWWARRSKHSRHTRDTGMDTTQTSRHPPPRILSVCRVNKALADHSAVPLFPQCDPHEPSDLIPSQLPHPGYNNSYFTALESPPLRNTDHNGLDTSVIVR